MTESEQKIEDITDIVGGYGPWQRNIFIVVFLIGLPAAWNNLLITLVAPPTEHWCAKPTWLLNVTDKEWKVIALPVVSTPGEPVQYSGCEMYEIQNQFNESSPAEFEFLIDNDTYSQSNRNLVPCQDFEYDHSQFKSTIVEEWDLVCDRAWLVSTSQSIYMIGYLVAVVFLGQISDRFGRRPVMLLSIVVLLASGIICSFSPNFIVFSTSRFFIAIGRAGLYVTAFVLLMETIGPTYRPVLGLAREFGWATGYVMLPGIAWLIRDWKFIQLAISLPVIGLLCIWWLIPESPRWLLTQHRVQDATKVIRKAAKKNGREVSELMDTLQRFTPKGKSEEEKKTVRSTALDLMKTPNMRKKTIVLCFNWFVNAFIFYGLSLNTGNVGGNVFLNVFITGAVEFPAYLVFIFVTRSLGRKIPLIATMVFGGLACILTIPVPQDMVWLKITLATFGKFCITASYGIVYVFSAEIYPTSVRNVGIGISATFARVGSVVAPFVKELGQYTDTSVPLGLLGFLGIIGGLLILLLPETNNEILPDTLEQGENFGKCSFRKMIRISFMKTTCQDKIKNTTECIGMKTIDEDGNHR